MSVQRQTQDRTKVVRGTNPRAGRRRDDAAQRIKLEQASQSLRSGQPRLVETREGLIAAGILRPGPAFTLLPRERVRRNAQKG